jgi:hypothetical protein
MRFPDSIGVRCFAGREPFSGTWIALALDCVEEGMKTVLSLAFGPTREDGRFVLQREDVLAQARYFEQVVGLDYGHLEERWDGRGWLAVAGAAELRHQLRLTFADPPLRQASAHRVAAARALRYLYEHESERLTVKVETELPKKVDLDLTVPRRGDWLPESLHEPVLELLTRLARRELAALIEARILAPETAARVEPDIALLLSTAIPDGEQAWTIEAPLWTREEGPSDLAVSIHARESETKLELELRGVALT